jgi:membrane-bound serine protease (ClpP class)
MPHDAETLVRQSDAGEFDEQGRPSNVVMISEISTYLISLPVGLLVLGYLCVLLEVFVPSGGILGIVASGFFIAAVAIAFSQFGPGFGVCLLAIVALSTPFLVAWGFYVWPATRLGQEMILSPPEPEEGATLASEKNVFSQAVGKTGRAETELLPGGMVKVEGVELPAVSIVAPVPKDQPVRVVRACGNYVLVEPFDLDLSSRGGSAGGGQRSDGSEA